MTLLMFVGGSFIAFGFLTMPVVIPLVVCMLLAIFMVEINRGLAPAEGGGMQVPVSLVAGLFVLLVTGPGPVFHRSPVWLGTADWRGRSPRIGKGLHR